MIRRSTGSGVYKDFLSWGTSRTEEKWSLESMHLVALGLPSVPWCIVPTRVTFLEVPYFPNFLNIPKLTKNIFADFSESVSRASLFSRFWSVPKIFFYVFFRCHRLDNIAFNINGCT